MTHDEAKGLLDISDAEDNAAVEAAFGQRSAVLARQIAAAPTPLLREKYEQQAKRLRQARDLLLDDASPRNDPGTLSLTKQRDLPARIPIATASGHSAPGEPETGDIVALSIIPGQVLADFPVWRSWTDSVKDDSRLASIQPDATAATAAAYRQQ